MVDVSDVADILEGDSERAEKICEAARELSTSNDESEEPLGSTDQNNDTEESDAPTESEGNKESDE